MEKGLTFARSDMANVRAMLARAIERGDTTGGAASVDDMAGGGQVYEVQQGGRQVAAYALSVADHAHARVVWVTAAAGTAPGVDLTAELLEQIYAQARSVHASQVAITTKRRGMLRKLRAQGFEVTGITLRKRI